MALIKLGGLAQDVRGSLNGNVFSRNRGGAYVRAKVSPVQPITDWNTKSRELFANVSKRWSNTLTDAQRAAWIAFAAVHPYVNVFGDSIILSGIAMYQALNKRLAQIGSSMLDDPPATFAVEPAEFTDAECTLSGGSLNTASVTTRALLTGEGIYILGTLPILGARTAQRSDYRLLNTEASGLFDTAETFHLSLQARFPQTAFEVGQKLNWLCAIMNSTTGAIAPAVKVPVTVSGS